jgi:two-component sensor histidine kinase
VRRHGHVASGLAVRHLFAVVLVTVVIATGQLAYETQRLYQRGLREVDEVLTTISGSYLPSISTSLFFFDDDQLRLLLEGIELLPYVDGVAILESRSAVDVPVIATGRALPTRTDAQTGGNRQIHEYPLVYEYDHESRRIGSLRVATNISELEREIQRQLRVTMVARLLEILAFALVILLIVQRMVFRHLTTITRFLDHLNPEDPGSVLLHLPRRVSPDRRPDELDGITAAINGMLQRQDQVLQEKSALVHELFHRTGNTVQSVQSILNLQSARYRENESLRAVVRGTNNRVLAIGLAHQKLYLRGDLSRIGMRDYLVELTEDIRRSYPSTEHPVQLRTEIADVSLLIDTAVPCGIVVCELLSNSLEHAFPRDGDGSTLGVVRITFEKTDDARYELTVEDNGIGLPPEFDIRHDGGTGLQVVVATLESQLRGAFETTTDGGLRWTIRFSDEVYRERVHNG